MFAARLTLGALLPFSLFVPLSVAGTWLFGWYSGPAAWAAPEWVEQGFGIGLHTLPLLIGFACLPLPTEALRWRVAVAGAYGAALSVGMEFFYRGLAAIGFYERLFP
ncbi:hypothetical protein [Alienimonas sp. DA493]|uniref:hypothetical protein n=1 Tax=Alienimonas sp. DA493 TaxID=3373605 RepID=UPI0037552E71